MPKSTQLWRVGLDGLLVGLVLATPFAIKGSGEPSITMKPINYAVWIAVAGMMGMLNSVTLYLLNGLVSRRMDA